MADKLINQKSAFEKGIANIGKSLAKITVPAEDTVLVCGHKKTKQAKTRARLNDFERVKTIFEKQGFAHQHDHANNIYQFNKMIPQGTTNAIIKQIQNMSQRVYWPDHSRERAYELTVMKSENDGLSKQRIIRSLDNL
jgi:hypothetical protein